MTVSIVNDSAKIVVTQTPLVNPPALNTAGTRMRFTTGRYIEAIGEVTLNGAAGDDASGWTAGFIQAQYTETSWCCYRGRNESDGSILLQRGRPPARPAQACRDCTDWTPVSDIFYNIVPVYGMIATGGPASSVFPQRLVFSFNDEPGESCKLSEENSLTRQKNYLAEVQIELFFCTVLSVRDPNGAFHHLAYFYWNQRWQATFQPLTFGTTPTFRITPVAAGTGTSVSPITRGTPTDTRFRSVLTSPQGRSCNQIARDAYAAVAVSGAPNRYESRSKKARFDVTKP